MQDKNEGVYQNSCDEIENIRMILKINYERCNQLASLNIQVVAILAAIILGALTFFGASYFTSTDPSKYWVIFITIHVISCMLLFWRYYAHIIDNDITKSYKKIIFCENRLNVPQELTLKSSLEKFLELLKNNLYINQTYENQCVILQKLIDINRIGYRFHDLLDTIAGGLIGVLLCAQFVLYIVIPIPLSNSSYESLLIMLPIAYCIGLAGLAWDIPNNIPIQRDPSKDDFEKIINSLSKTN